MTPTNRNQEYTEKGVVTVLLTLLLAVVSSSDASADDPTNFGACPEIVGRDAWGARPSKRPYGEHAISRITIHHQGIYAPMDQDVAQRLRNMQHYHQTGDRDFTDIAYHFIIDRRGIVYEGRPIAAPGGGRYYDTNGHLLICLLGDFMKQYPTHAQRNGLISLVSGLMAELDLPVEAVGGHRDYADTTCPGIHLYDFITSDGFKRALRQTSEPSRARRSTEPETPEQDG